MVIQSLIWSLWLKACSALSRALMHLNDLNVIHGKVRASNVFVAEHTDRTFQVK